MSQNHFQRMIVCFWLSSLFLSACRMPGLRTPAPQGVEVIQTAAAQTIQADLQTRSAATAPPLPTAPGLTPFPSLTPLLFSTPTPAPTMTPLPPTQTPLPCDLARFIQDVTVPDNTEFSPGTPFVKTWRLQNAGTCAWSPAYALVVEGENIFNAPVLVPLPGNVPPGGTVDISVNLVAPSVAGTYRGNFLLANPSGRRFGLGDGSKPFWAQIKVTVPGGMSLDFLASASQATWKSGTGNNWDTPLTFGGADDDPNGVAKIVNGLTLENGNLSGKVLLTFPKHVNNGSIAGLFPPYLVQSGDFIKGRIGFLANSGGACGAGLVRFQILYTTGSGSTLLGEWQKSCDGKLLPISLDLSSLKGQTVQFILVVKAEGPFTDDWAIWNSLRVER